LTTVPQSQSVIPSVPQSQSVIPTVPQSQPLILTVLQSQPVIPTDPQFQPSIQLDLSFGVAGSTLQDIAPQSATQSVLNYIGCGQIIQLTHDIPTGNWALPAMYQVGQIGKERMWQVGYDSVNNQVVTVHGQVGGKMQQDRREVKATGNKNNSQQAFIRAKHRYEVKWRDGYRPRGEAGYTRLPAQESVHYNPKGWPKRHSNETSNIKYPVAVQPKLDGLRCRAFLEYGLPSYGISADQERIILLTRNNKEFKFFNQLREELKLFFSFFPLGTGLDGELYNHEMAFEEIVSVCRQQKSVHDRILEVQYHIFDVIIPELSTEKRVQMLNRAFQSYTDAGHSSRRFLIVRTELMNTQDEVIQKHHQYVSQGYEGLMIRKTEKSIPRKISECHYRGKRNNSMLKFKLFVEEEVTVVSVEDGEGRESGLAMFTVQDAQGNTFATRPKGSFELRRHWYQNPDQCIGRMYTIKFQERTADGIPRFPIGKAFRDDSKRPGIMVY